MALKGRIGVVLDALVSEAQRLGIFERVNTHESKSAPGTGMHCDIWWDRLAMNPGRSGLSSTSAVNVYQARIVVDFIQSPEDSIDGNLISAVETYIDSIHGELGLGDPGSSVDVFGMSGIPIDAVAGYLNQDSNIYRAATITLPIIMDDAWTQVN